MKILFYLSIFSIIIGCSPEPSYEGSNKVYSMDDVASAGLKVKKDFATEFPDATHAKWGFYKGRDVAVIRYDSVELANASGQIAGSEQTQKIEVVEKNIAHGPKVERTECRGHKANKPNSSSVYFKSDRSQLGFEDTILLNKLIFIEESNKSQQMKPSWMACVRREPMYTEFLVHGNLVIMIEPLATEDKNDTVKFLEKTASSLP